ncbi:hypothetical protein Agub_g138, partial [Astrephomene gubernaculifera]
MQSTPAADNSAQADADAMEVENTSAAPASHPSAATCTTKEHVATAAAAKKHPGPIDGGVSRRGKRRRSGGSGTTAGAGSDGEESSGDLQSDGDEDEDEEEEDEEGESGSEGEGEEESGDEMASASDEGEEEEEEEGEEEEAGGRGGRRRKGGGGGGSGGGADAAPVKKAAAAMAVGVGSFSDPDDLQGLSHYLEHMLFMGSAKYPSENEYDDFLTRHGGAANAFTDLEVTNYHFEVSPPHLAGALDRFAQFFISPLCAEGSLEREVLAVDSEFAQVRQDDHCRLSQVMCHTARPGHIYRKFSWGNKASLWEQPRQAGIDVRQRLLEYYKQHYGADRSCLVVLGGEPLEQLAQLVARCFADMPGGRGPAPSFKQLGPPFQGRFLHVIPAVRDNHELRLTFQLPPLQRLYGSKADSYLSHLLGHEGRGSLLSALKSRGWATEILAGVDEDGYSSNTCCSLFGLDISLTEAGLAAGSPAGAGLGVVALVAAYLDMMRREGPQEWVWQEMRAVAEQRWRFLEEGDPLDGVSKLAGAMHVVSPAHTLAADYLHEAWQPQLVGQLLDCMMAAPTAAGEGEEGGEPPAFRIDLMTRRYEEVKASLLSLAAQSGASVRQEQEPWFGLEVTSLELPPDLVRGWAQQPPLPELALPPRNPYLPQDFSLRCEDPEQQQPAPAPPPPPPGLPALLASPPQLLLDIPGLRLWHKLDTTFRTPRAAVHWRLFSPAGHTDPRVAAASHLTLKLLEEALREDAYLADVAGLHYATSPEGLAGMEFRVDGFSDKLGVLVGRLAGALTALGRVELGGKQGQEQGQQQQGQGQQEGAVGAVAVAPGGDQLVISGEWLAGQFGAVREALVRKYRNMNMEVGKHASYSRLFVLCSRALHCDDILTHMESLTPEDIPPFVSSLLSRCHVEAFVHGNVTAAGARQLAAAVTGALGEGCCMGAEERVRDRCVVVPVVEEAGARAARQGGEKKENKEGEGGGVAEEVVLAEGEGGTVVRLLAKNPEEENAALEVYYQLGPATDPRDRALLDLIDQILYEPCYDTLRTKQQLGYSVYSGTRLTSGVSGFCIQVVSARHPPEYLDRCVESFLASMAPRLAGLTPAELATHVAALTASKLQRDRSLVEEAGRQWEHISSTRYDFLSREQEVAALGGVSVADVYDTFVRYLAPPSAVGKQG